MGSIFIGSKCNTQRLVAWTRCGSSQRCVDPLAAFLGGPTKEGKLTTRGKCGVGTRREGKEGGEDGMGEEILTAMAFCYLRLIAVRSVWCVLFVTRDRCCCHSEMLTCTIAICSYSNPRQSVRSGFSSQWMSLLLLISSESLLNTTHTMM